MDPAADLAFFTRDPAHARRWKETQRISAPAAFFQVSGQRPPSATQSARSAHGGASATASGHSRSPRPSSGRYSPPLLAAWHGVTVTRRADSAHSARRAPATVDTTQHEPDEHTAPPSPFHFAPTRSSDPAVRSAACSSGGFVRRTNPLASLRLLSLASDAAAAIEVSQRREQLHRLVAEAEAKEQMYAAHAAFVAGESRPVAALAPHSATLPRVQHQPQTVGWTRHNHKHANGHYASTPSSPSARPVGFSQPHAPPLPLQLPQPPQSATSRSRSSHATPRSQQSQNSPTAFQANPNHPHAHAHAQQAQAAFTGVPSPSAGSPRRTPRRPAGAAAKTPRALASFQRPRTPPYVFAPPASSAARSSSPHQPTPKLHSSSARESPLPQPVPVPVPATATASVDSAPAAVRPPLEPIAPLSPNALRPLPLSAAAWSAATSAATSATSSRLASPISSRTPFPLAPLDAPVPPMDLTQPGLLAVPVAAASPIRAQASPPLRPQQPKPVEPQTGAPFAETAPTAVAATVTPATRAVTTASANASASGPSTGASADLDAIPPPASDQQAASPTVTSAPVFAPSAPADASLLPDVLGSDAPAMAEARDAARQSHGEQVAVAASPPGSSPLSSQSSNAQLGSDAADNSDSGSEDEKETEDESEEEEEEEAEADDGRHSPLAPVTFDTDDEEDDEAVVAEVKQDDAAVAVPSAAASSDSPPAEENPAPGLEQVLVETNQLVAASLTIEDSPFEPIVTEPYMQVADELEKELEPVGTDSETVADQAEQKQQDQDQDATDDLPFDDAAAPAESADPALAPTASEETAPVVTAAAPAAVAPSEKSTKSAKQSGRSGTRAKARRPSMSVTASAAAAAGGSHPSTGHARRASNAPSSLTPHGGSSASASPSISPAASHKKTSTTKVAKKRKGSVAVPAATAAAIVAAPLATNASAAALLPIGEGEAATPEPAAHVAAAAPASEATKDEAVVADATPDASPSDTVPAAAINEPSPAPEATPVAQVQPEPAGTPLAAPIAALVVPTPKHARTPSSGSSSARGKAKKSPRAAVAAAEPKAKPAATPKAPKTSKAAKSVAAHRSHGQLPQPQPPPQQLAQRTEQQSEQPEQQQEQQPTLETPVPAETAEQMETDAPSASADAPVAIGAALDTMVVGSAIALPAASPSASPRRRGPAASGGLSKGRAAKLAPSPVAAAGDLAALTVKSAAVAIASPLSTAANLSIATAAAKPVLSPSLSASPKHGPTSFEDAGGSRRSRPNSSPRVHVATPASSAAAALAAEPPLSLSELSEFGAAPRRLKPRAWTPMPREPQPVGRSSPTHEDRSGAGSAGTTRKVNVLHMQLPADTPTLARPVPAHREGMMQHSSAYAAPPPLTAEELRGAATSPSSWQPQSDGAAALSGAALDEFAQTLMRRRKRGSGPGGEGAATPERLHPGRSRAASPHPDSGGEEVQFVLTEHERELIAAEAFANGEDGAGIFSGQSIYGAAGVLQGSGVHVRSGSPTPPSPHGYALQPRPGRPELDVTLTRGVGFDHVSPSSSSQPKSAWGFGYKDKDQRWVQRVRNEIVPENPNPYRTRAATQTLVEFMAALSTGDGRSPAAWRYTPYKKKHLAAARGYDEDVDEHGVENPKRKRYREALEQLQAEANARGEGGAGGVLPSFPSYEEFESDQKASDAESRRQRFLALYDAPDDESDEEDEKNGVESGRRSPPRAPFPTARLLYLPECDLEPDQCADVNCLHYEERLLAEAHAQKQAEREERARVRAAKQAEQTRRAMEYHEWLKMSENEKEAALLVREKAKEAAAKAAVEEATRKLEQAEKERFLAERAERAAAAAAEKLAVSSPVVSPASPPAAPAAAPAPLPLAELVLLQPERFELSPRGYNARRASLNSPLLQALPSPTGALAAAITTPAMGSAPDAYAVTPAAVQQLPLLSLVTDFNETPVQLVGRRVSAKAPTKPQQPQPQQQHHPSARSHTQRQRRLRHHAHTRSMVEALHVQATAGRLAAHHPHEPELLKLPSGSDRERSASPSAGAATVRKITPRNMQPAPVEEVKILAPPPPPLLAPLTPAVQAAFAAARRRASANPNNAPAAAAATQ